MRRFTITAVLLVVIFSAHAQSTNIKGAFQNSLKKADQQYNNLAYRNALELYLAVVDKDSANLAARERIADCYFRLGQLAEAERWYAPLAARTDVPPQYKYQYAQVLASRGKYLQSEKWMMEYRKVNPDPRAESKIEFIYGLSYYLRDSTLYQVKNLPYNSNQSDFAPQYFKNGVVFVSARDRDMFVKHKSTSALNDEETMLNIYFVTSPETAEEDAAFFSEKEMKSHFHDGPIAFYDNYKKAVYSRNNMIAGKPIAHNGKVNLKLYFAHLNSANNLERVEPFPFNDDAFSIAHPWISEDGKTLYFASNQPGGIGGVDIYMSVKKGNTWEKPVNLGVGVNTAGDEFYPYEVNDTTLYFSSTGHGGFGGLDIYKSHKRHGSWAAPENLGYPLNTPSDDFSMIMDKTGRNGMFASNRNGGVGYDDIYSFSALSFSIVGRTVDRVNPSNSIAGAKITISTTADEPQQWSDTMITNDNGYFYLDVPFDKSFKFSAEKAGYLWVDTLEFSTYTRAVGRDSVLMKLLKEDLFAKGTIYSNETQTKLLDATVYLRNTSDNKIDSVRTSDGSYNFLIKPNKKYVISAKREGFISREFELNTAGIMQGQLVNDLVLEEVFEEKLVLQFDLDKSEIKSQSHASLDRLAGVMKRNKKFHLHVGAYADARGTHEYNLALSNRRASEVVKYLEGHGVAANRITAIGFGEALLLNQCSNGVICHDDDHAKNRRAELKVQR